MLILTWVLGSIAGILLAASAAFWIIFVAADNRDWRRLAVKVFRVAMVFVLLIVNVWIYAHIFGVAAGIEKPVQQLIEEE